MKFFHYSAGTVGRSSGRSCVQAVAYATRSALYEERRGIKADYTNIKDHDISWETLSPDGSGIDKKDLSIWNKAELDEDRILAARHKDPQILEKKKATARPAYADHFALPKELTREQNTALVLDYVNATFISKGLVATYSIHWEEGNPHVHITYSSRPYEKGEFGASKTVSRSLRGPGGVRGLREAAAHIINKHQERAGLEDRVDPRSYAQRGIDLIATQHKGWQAHQWERDGLSSRISQDNAAISQENKERIAREPGIIIQELTATQATFSEKDVVRLMQKRLKDDIGILGDHVFHGVMQEAAHVGIGIDHLKRYTSREYFEKEERVLESLEALAGQKAAHKIDSATVEAELANLEANSQKTGFKPNGGQVNGIRALCGDAQLSVMIGRAGTGKTTTLQSVVRLHEAAGYTVTGMAPSAAAAAQLEADTGCKSDTIAHYAYYWKEYDKALERLHAATTDKERQVAQKAIRKYAAYLPDNKTLILVDEAGMVGTGDRNGAIPGGWDAIAGMVQRTGAKLILTGDDHQFKPVEAGDIFRKLIHRLKGMDRLCALSAIRRQEAAWMREASHHLAELNVATALGMYETYGHIEQHQSSADVYEAMARQYLRNHVREPDSRGMVIAATNEECRALNREIRSVLKANGLLPEQDVMRRGEDGYCAGDRIVFTKNDRGFKTRFDATGGFFVQNSMQAVIQDIKPVTLAVKETGEIIKTFEIVAQGPRKATIRFNVHDYRDFAHGYAVTGHKSQGNTMDWVLAKLSRFMDAHALYVMLTRHRQDISLYYAQEDFASYQSLVSSLSRVNVKDLVVDYSVSDEHQEYWQNVQDYKETGRELQGIRALARSLDQGNKAETEAVWKNYRSVEEDRKSWANHILRDWEEHKDFVRQAGLTRESLEIAAGLKKRSLCRVEVEAQQTVEQYVAVSLEARELWRDIRRTHPGARARSHPEWPKFEDARNHRGVLANQVCLNPVLYRPFLKETGENLAKADMGYVTRRQKISYSMATIKAQAEAHQSKMLQMELLKDNSKPAQQDMLKVLMAYTESRDMAGAIWQEVRPKLKEFEGTLLKESFAKTISEYSQVRMKRDAAALQIAERQKAFTELAEKVGMKLDFEKLNEQTVQATRDKLFKTYQSSPEEMTRLEAAFEINALVKGEAELGKKPTISQVYQQGLQPQDITRDALEYQKLKLYESLKTETERGLFLLLDEYDAKCRAANQIYSQCIEETKGKNKNTWESSHYPAYKDACHSRNDIALEVFDQRDHDQVIAMAEAMGIRFKDIELEEIFSRCEQATRTNNILSYLKAGDSEAKGKAAVAIGQMVEFERKEKGVPSKTARQAFHSGIDFKELQAVAFDYGRSCVLKGLSSEKEVDIYHALEAYENAVRPAKSSYKGCIAEGRLPDVSKEKTKNVLEVKPWETEKFKEYISLVSIQDEKAYELIKGYDAASVGKIAREMGISLKRLDVEAHRHSLRQTLQSFTGGDRTNVPMAARETLNWLEFDRHSDHKHTFKILREQDLWPNDIQKGLQQFFEKKREWRQEERRSVKGAAKAATQGRSLHKPEYQTIIYERRQSFEEVDKQLKERMFELATDVLGTPTSRTSTQLRFGRKGSVCVFTHGPKQGLYANHETGVYGGPLKLIEEQAGLSSARDSLKWASEWLGGNPLMIEQRIVRKKPDDKQPSVWTPIIPVPGHVKAPDIRTDTYLKYMLKDGARETARYTYRDEHGNLKGYVYRIEKADGSKITPPLAWCQNERGFKAWKWQGFEKDNRTPYGIEKLSRDPGKPILVVEGEKTADAAQKLLPEYHALTWNGGAGSVGKTNWECLVGREVTIWPDHDEKSIKASETLQKILSSLNAERGLHVSTSIVCLPDTLPEKWDLADKLPAGWTRDTIKGLLAAKGLNKDNAPVVTNKNIDSDKNYSFQEKAILDYLNQELKTEKNSWLDQGDIERFSRQARDNPTAMLEKWQKITEDYSFNAASALSKDHAVSRPAEKMYTTEEEEIRAYLNQEISREKHPWLNDNDCQKYSKAAEENPARMLKIWQAITEDYSFNATPVQETAQPLSAQHQLAQKLLADVDDFATPKMIKEWNAILADSPQAVIEGCQNLIHQHKADMEALTMDAKCEIAARKFLSLCNQIENLSFRDPQFKILERDIEVIAETYLKDEKFMEKIKSADNEHAVRKMEDAQHQQERSRARGYSLDI